MKSNYQHIFTPLTVKNMTIKNRIVMMPMGTNYGEQNGEMSFLHINYYKERAKGGTGLIIVENASVDSPQGSNGTTQLRIDHDNYLPRLYKFCEEIHKYGTCIAIQINHAGASAVSARTNMQPVSASDVPSKEGGEIPRPLSVEEIHHIVKKYGEAAKRAQAAGFDAVEIHAGHSYLISQFLSPLTNKRTDEFGGSVENRTRFCRMVIEEVRKQVGPFFPIMLRLSADELMEGGNTLEDTLEYLEYVQDEVDIFDVSCGLNGSIQYQIDANYMKDGWRSYMPKAVREKFGKPCISMGNIRNPKVAEQILADGDADLIGMGRGLIADPEWVNKVEFGDECDIRKCISCNIGCAGNRIGVNRPIRCTVNPTVNSGFDYKKKKVNKPCNVVVIGGGTAGLEAACTAAEVGCATVLIEKSGELGGLARRVGKMPNKQRLGYFPQYLERRAMKLKNLFICKNTEASIEFIEGFKPDIVVNATGSVPLLPNIPGLKENLEAGNVSTIFDLVDHVDSYPEDLSGKKVVVIGGGTAGLEAACTAAEVGCNTFLLEKGETLGGLASVISKIPAKKRLADFPNYLIHRAEQLENLYIFTNTEGTPENIRKFHPNLIVSSTGSAPLLPPIKGLHDRIDKKGSKVASILGMINHINDYPEDMTGKKVVVVGGGAVGLDVVEFFAARNAEISIVEMMDQIGRDLDPVTKNDMKDQMKKHHVAQLTKTALQEVKDSSFLVKDAEGERELSFDYGFVCLGMRAQGQLFAELSDAFVSDDVEILNIGDSKRARRIIDGTLEGRNILNTLTQMGYLQ